MNLSHARTRGLGRPFANLFTANLATNLGDGIARTAIPLLAARLTDDPFLIGLIAAFAMLPWLLLAVPSGILIDRIDRRFAIAVAQAVRVVLGLALIALVLTSTLTIWWLFLVVFIYGAFETLSDGAVRAIPASIVHPADLPRANGRLEAGELVMQNFVAAPLTSLLFAVSVLIPLGANAAVYLLAGVVALLLPRSASGRDDAHPDDAGVPWYRQFSDGLRFILADKTLARLWGISSLLAVLLTLAMATWVLYALGPLGVPEAWFGVFLLSGAVGGVIGSALADRCSRRWGFGPTVAWSITIASTAVLLIGTVPNIWVAVAGNAVHSAALTVWSILGISFRQSVIPRRLFGRVQGTWRTLLWGLLPIGSALGGLIGRVDLALSFLVGGGAALLISIGAFGFLSRLPEPGSVHVNSVDGT